MNTSPTVSGASPALASAPRIAVAPRSGARTAERVPRNAPMGVRAAEAM